jgi:hypothetical protein
MQDNSEAIKHCFDALGMKDRVTAVSLMALEAKVNSLVDYRDWLAREIEILKARAYIPGK